MVGNFLMNHLVNPLVRFLAHTPLHKLVDEGVLLVTFTGRKSGRTISVPVNYLQKGKEIHIISLRSRNWWRNLKGGASVEVLLNGRQLNGWAVLMMDKQNVSAELKLFCEANPKYPQYVGINRDEQGNILQTELLKASRERVAVKISLS
jgi:hypothetical protein